MGWFSKITGGIKHGFDEAAEKAKEAAEAAAREAAAVAAATKRAAEAAAEKTKELAEAAARKAKEAADDTGNSFVHAANAASSAAVTAWTATSSEAKDVSSAVEKGGITIGNGFIQGATVVGKGVEEGAEEVGKGAVALAGYVSEHACSIGIGSALSAAFVALATNGEEEATVGSIAALAAKGFVKTAALKTAATALAFILVEPVYAIPGVSKSVGHKSELESAIAFLIVTACKAKPKLVVGSGGQYLAGALIYGITTLVCEGKLPGGFTVFKGGGLQGQIT